MQVIAADIGNSSTKVAVEHAAHDNHWRLETIIRGDQPVEIDFAPLDLDTRPAFWSVSSVNQRRQQHLADWVAERRPDDTFHIITDQEVELGTRVQSRTQLGRDRLIAAWQAVQLNDGGPVVVVDAGTAVTIDLVDADNQFCGGLIFPGAASMLNTLAAQTDALPDLSRVIGAELREKLFAEYGRSINPLPTHGTSTEMAMLLGVYHAQVSAIRHGVQSLSQLSGNLPDVYVTGGGIDDLLDWLPDNWQFVPDLVLQGAYHIGVQRVQRGLNGLRDG